MNRRTITPLVATLFYFICAVITSNSGASVLEDLSSSSFVAFESGQVRLLVLSPDGRRLYAVHLLGVAKTKELDFF